MSTKAKVSATEVRDGMEYTGKISIEERVIDYSIELPERIDILDKQQDLDPRKLLNDTKIEVKLDDRVIDLSEQEKGFIFAYGFSVCRNLFYSPQREDLRFNGIGSDIIEFYAERVNPDRISDRKLVQHTLESEMPIDVSNPIIRGVLLK